MYIIRQTLLNDYLLCPHMALHRWGKFGEKSPCDESSELANKYAEIGTAFHSTMEKWAINKKGGIQLSKEDLWHDLKVNVHNIPISLFDGEEDKDKFLDSLKDQLDWIQNELLTTPLSVEEKFENVELIEGLPCFSGTIDRIDGDINRRSLTLKDYKTGKVYTKKQLEENLQATIYSLYIKKKYGFYPGHFVFLFSKHKKSKTIFITEEYIERNVQKIKEVWSKILNQEFNPHYKRNKYFCNHFCNYKPKCISYTKVPKGWENVGS